MDEIMISDKGKKLQKKNKCIGIMLMINFVLILIVGFFGYILIDDLKKDIKNCQSNASNNTKKIIQNSLKLKEFENKNYIENTSFIAQIDEIKRQIENNDSKEQILNNVSTKLKELESKFYEDNTSLRKQINEINIQNSDLKELISQKDIKIQTGEYWVDFNYEDYEYMFNSKDWRTYSAHINFEEKYERPPKVLLFINKLDSDKNSNLRISFYSSNIDTNGFDLNLQTWDDSIIYGFRIIWISFLK